MPNGNELLYFLTCTTQMKSILECKGEDEIKSIYYVCGRHPWLIIFRSDSINDAINFSEKHKLGIEYMSISSNKNFAKKRENDVKNKEHIFWIFLKGTKFSHDKFLSFIDETLNDYDITDAYKIFGEYNYIVKFYAGNIDIADNFLILCQKNEIYTSTKCVLSKFKENDDEIIYDSNSKKVKAISQKKDLNYAMARIMANTKDFIYKNKKDQEWLLDNRSRKMGLTFSEDNIKKSILDPDINESEYSINDLYHSNYLIDRYSIKLNKPGWLKTLFFFKAKPGKKKELEDTLQQNLLGVTNTQFSRKLYHMTGSNDFMVPFDCADIDILTEVIDKFLNDYGILITNFTNTVCRPDRKGEPKYLNTLDKPFIRSLLINSTKIVDYEHRIKEKSIFSIGRAGRLGITPREDYVIDKFEKEDKNIVNKYLDDFSSFEDIGIESTVEFKDDALIQVFLKFNFENVNLKDKLINEIEKMINNCDIIAIIYEPVRDPLTVMCIFMFKRFVELEVILEALRKFCRKIEFHVIFHQTYYSKLIEQNIRCKPCFYPQHYQSCAKCIRYILPRIENRTLNINFDDEIKEEITISLIGIDLDLAKYFALEKLLDNNKIRSNIFRKCQKEINVNFNELKQQYNIISEYNIENYRNEYKHAIINILNYILKSNSDIIIFPEYAIPSYVFDEIKKSKINYDCLIVAGSHIDNNGYNVCPVIFNKRDNNKNVYLCYKNNISPLEKKLNLMKSRGTAHLKFLNTKFGNIYIKICYDVFSTRAGGRFENVDILLVPSYNPSNKFKESIVGIVNEYKLVAAYANTINLGKIKSNIFIPPEDGLYASVLDLQPFHEDRWKEIELDLKNPIFCPSPEKNKIKKLMQQDFIFRIKHLTFNIGQLDKRREIKSR